MYKFGGEHKAFFISAHLQFFFNIVYLPCFLSKTGSIVPPRLLAVGLIGPIFFYTMPRVKLFDEQKVLESAMELFWKKGFHDTSIDDLVKHLGVNRGSLYSTYGGKKALFVRTVQYYRALNTDRVKVFLSAEKDTKKGLRKLFKQSIQASVCDTDRKGCFVVNTATELTPGDPDIIKLIKDNEKAFEGIFYKYLKQGEQNGDFAPGKNLKAIAHLIFMIHSGLKVVAKVNTNEKQLMQSVDAALSLLD